jgi:23S rRNA (pseudouridine1915-N3)-methyltransferase
MRIKVLCIGSTREKWIDAGIGIYLERLRHYALIDWMELKEPKTSGIHLQLESESALIRKNIPQNAPLILFDERGKTVDSTGFAHLIEGYQIRSHKEVVFCIGGAYGFSEGLKTESTAMISLSKLTFTHQMVRLIVAEQIYRAFTILKGESYHH